MSDKSADEMLDYLCWYFATEGMNFYPPEETAEDCMDSVEDMYEKRSEDDWIESFGWERGQHSRAWTTATEFFVQMDTYGFDPVMRAEREQRRTNAQIEGEGLRDLDWEWLRKCGRYKGEVPE